MTWFGVWKAPEMDDVFGDAAMAIVLGDLDQLRSLLSDDPGLATRTSSVGHPTLLQLVACEAANLPDPAGVADALVDAGAPMAGPLVAAAGCDSPSVVRALLARGGDVEGEGTWTPLDEAIYWCQSDMIALLTEHGARPRALSAAAGLGDIERVRSFFDPSGDVAPGAGPIGSPFPDTVSAELADDPASIVDHAFVMAVNAGQQATAAELLSRGARVNGTPPGYHWHGTALHAAVWRGGRGLVQWLLGAGADASIRDGLADSDAAGWARHHGQDHLLDLF